MVSAQKSTPPIREGTLLQERVSENYFIRETNSRMRNRAWCKPL